MMLVHRVALAAALAFFALLVVGCGKSMSDKRIERLVARLQRTLTRSDLCPAWSPDGRKIVYPTRAKPETGGVFARDVGNGLLAIIDVDRTRGGLLGGGIRGDDPQWSPDGLKLVFARRGAGAGLFVVNVDGTGLRRLTAPYSGLSLEDPFAQPFAQPVWSPDGSRIAYKGAPGDLAGPIDVVDADGTNWSQVVPASAKNGNTDPSWSSDGTAIAFTEVSPPSEGYVPVWRVAVVNADGSGLRVIGPGPTASRPTWAPDGKRIAFEDFTISIVNTDGTGRKRLTPLDGPEALEPAWSPDGEGIVYSQVEPGKSSDIYVIDASGGDARQLTRISEGGGLDGCPAWSPDGTRIAFRRSVERGKFWWGVIFVINSDGSGERQLTQTTL